MRLREESKHRRKYNIQMDLREIVRESVVCIELAQERKIDRVLWYALLMFLFNSW
jgi:hypothetical protein